MLPKDTGEKKQFKYCAERFAVSQRDLKEFLFRFTLLASDGNFLKNSGFSDTGKVLTGYLRSMVGTKIYENNEQIEVISRKFSESKIKQKNSLVFYLRVAVLIR